MISPNFEFDQYATVSSANVPTLSVPCTFQVRFKLLYNLSNNGGETISFMSHSDVGSGNGAFLIWASGPGGLRVNIRDEDGTSVGAVATITSGDYLVENMWTCVVDESNVVMYRNTTLLDSDPHSLEGVITRVGRDLDFGKFNYAAIYSSIKYFEARIWDKALTPAEIAANLERGSVEPTAANLVSLWRFNERSNTIEDLVGSADAVIQNPLSGNKNWSGRVPVTNRNAIS